MTNLKKHRALIAGTLLLTAAGFLTRILGFFYRIFLSRTIGAEGLGLYHMVHPIYGICFALCAGSIQTAISRFVAAETSRDRTNSRAVFGTGLFISLSLSLMLTAVLIRFSGPIAQFILMEERCSHLLPYMALSVPLSSIHACINGYYYGLQKTKVPAAAQVAEQTIRMGAVFLIARILLSEGRTITVELAAAGHLIGELASCLFTVFCFSFSNSLSRQKNAFLSSFASTAPPLMALALPLMGNRLVLNLLSSAEAIWIPSCLQESGLTSQEAFSVYGVLTGMAMPFILFPSAITNSMAVVLLPSVAEAQAAGKENRIAQTISLSLRYSLYMGVLCIGVFTLFGRSLGISVFQDISSGIYMQVLAWLCPFLYLATTMGSILNGLGQTSVTFFQNVAALLLRLIFVLLGIPRFGIRAWLCGLLFSEILLAVLHLISLKRLVDFSWEPWETILKPALALLLSVGILFFLSPVWAGFSKLPLFLSTALQAGILSLLYGALLLVLKKRA